MTIRAFIVDDEPLARRRLRELCAREPDVEVVGEAGDGAAAVAAIRATRPDLLFLDVHIPELDGFGVLARLPGAVPAIVFVTAYDEYALRAFEVAALDYLLKPFDGARFQAMLRRARAALGSDEGRARLEAILGALGRPRLLAVKDDGRVQLVRADEIDWIEAADNYVCVHAGRDTHILRATLTAVEGRLDPSRFARIHRSTVVALDRIRELRPATRNEVVAVLRDGTRLPVSRTYAGRLRSLLGT
ncbi:MAG TPA: LytTR family DNA-binding domain-containing protein [Haliangiales bacterium]|nr:LytTR family DNA-binding domain-containing protein [Haliangiales bacterium]